MSGHRKWSEIKASKRAHAHEWRIDVTAGTRYCGGEFGCGEVEPTGNSTAEDAAAWRGDKEEHGGR